MYIQQEQEAVGQGVRASLKRAQKEGCSQAEAAMTQEEIVKSAKGPRV